MLTRMLLGIMLQKYGYIPYVIKRYVIFVLQLFAEN